MNAIRANTLVLEPQVAAHAPEMFVVLSDRAIYEFEGSPPESLAWLERRFSGLESRASPDGSQQWLNWVVRLHTGALAGYVQATISRDRVAQVAYVLSSAYWGRGFGKQAVAAMLVELAATYSVHTCLATLKQENYRSFALLRSLGFEPYVAGEVAAVMPARDEISLCKVLS